jgi:hypothetical protein
MSNAKDTVEKYVEDRGGDYRGATSMLLEHHGVDPAIIDILFEIGMPADLVASVSMGMVMILEAQSINRKTAQDLEDQFNG